MSSGKWVISRRRLLQWLAATGASGIVPTVGAVENDLLQRTIPASGEKLPAIGMGTWITFDVGRDPILRDRRCDVLRTFFELGGALVDSSPMYGSSEEVIGYCLDKLGNNDSLFSATKVWTPGQQLGVYQMEHSLRLWGVPRFDLMQIHNMLDWEAHLETLKEMKAEGKIRYIGITTSHGRRHAELERVMAREDAFDFVQFTYNLVDREAEQRLLPLAAEQGLAVIINRPFRGGGLFDYVSGKLLPPWAAEFDCENWAQFFLKFIVSHPAVTCAIPATTRVEHMRENMGTMRGRLPTAKMRERMIRHFTSLYANSF